MKIHLTKKELEAVIVAGIGTQIPSRDADVVFEVIDYGPPAGRPVGPRYEVKAAVISLTVKGED